MTGLEIPVTERDSQIFLRTHDNKSICPPISSLKQHRYVAVVRAAFVYLRVESDIPDFSSTDVAERKSSGPVLGYPGTWIDDVRWLCV